MTIRFDRPVSSAAAWARRAGFIAFVMTLAAWGDHRFGTLPTPHFTGLIVLAAALGLLACLLALIGLTSLWTIGAKGGKASVAAILLSLPPLVIVGLAVSEGFRKPALLEVASDTSDPPPWIEQVTADQMFLPARRPTTAQDWQIQAAAYPALAGRRYEGAIDRVLQAVREVAAEQGIEITRTNGLANAEADPEDTPANPTANGPMPADDAIPIPLPRPITEEPERLIGRSTDVLLQGDQKSRIFGFRFDVVIRLREESETTLVDIRAASRYGIHDLGGCDRLAEGFLRALDTKLLGIAGQ